MYKKRQITFLILIAFITMPFSPTLEANASSEGWCQVWNNKGNLIDKEQCTVTESCDEDSGEMCFLTYHWPSGARTVLNYADGFFESLNGLPADNVSVQGTRCAFNPESMNTFCFTETPQTADAAVFSVDDYKLNRGGVPRISFAATWPDDDNSKVVSLLERSDGKTVFVESIDFSGHPFPEFRAVEERCYSNGTIEITEPNALAQSTIYLPVPAEYYRANKKHLFFDPETYEEYLCEFGVRFELNEPREFPFSSGGTGILALQIDQEFRVSVLVSGIETIFHLREVRDDSSSKPEISNPPKSDSCSLPNGNTTYQQEAEAWLEILPNFDLNSSSQKLFVCPDFKKVLESPLRCLKSDTLRAISSWETKLACG